MTQMVFKHVLYSIIIENRLVTLIFRKIVGSENVLKVYCGRIDPARSIMCMSGVLGNFSEFEGNKRTF
jgi:hypothetical protein